MQLIFVFVLNTPCCKRCGQSILTRKIDRWQCYIRIRMDSVSKICAIWIQPLNYFEMCVRKPAVLRYVRRKSWTGEFSNLRDLRKSRISTYLNSLHTDSFVLYFLHVSVDAVRIHFIKSEFQLPTNTGTLQSDHCCTGRTSLTDW